MFARKPDWTVLEVTSCSGRPLDLASSLTKLIRHKFDQCLLLFIHCSVCACSVTH